MNLIYLDFAFTDDSLLWVQENKMRIAIKRWRFKKSKN